MPIRHPVPDNLLTQIGDMTVSFASLEFHMQLMFVNLLKQSARIGHILASQLTFTRLRASLISLYKERYGEDTDFHLLKDLMVKAGKIEEERNLITHSIWGRGETSGSITRIKLTAREKRGFHAEYKQYDEKLFREFVANMQKLTEEIFLFDVEVIQKKV